MTTIKGESLGNAALELNGLGKDYGELRALDALTLTIEPGEIFGLLGPNGAGKSTALRLILGFLSPNRGSASVFGVDVQKASVKTRESIGYLPGDVKFDPRPTGKEVLQQLGCLRPSFDPAYRNELIEKFDFDSSKQVAEYSKGNRQKLGIIAALQHRPPLLLLDEPTSGLDPLMQRTFYSVMQDLAKSGTAILFSSHVLSEVSQVCGRVGVLREGELVFEKSVLEFAQETVRRVEIVFDDPIPTEDDLNLPGTLEIECHGNRFVIYLESHPDEVIKALGQYKLRDVVFERPDVNDLFMGFYRGDA